MTNKSLGELADEMQATIKRVEELNGQDVFKKTLDIMEDQLYEKEGYIYCDGLSDVAEGWYKPTDPNDFEIL